MCIHSFAPLRTEFHFPLHSLLYLCAKTKFGCIKTEKAAKNASFCSITNVCVQAQAKDGGRIKSEPYNL